MGDFGPGGIGCNGAYFNFESAVEIAAACHYGIVWPAVCGQKFAAKRTALYTALAASNNAVNGNGFTGMNADEVAYG